MLRVWLLALRRRDDRGDSGSRPALPAAGRRLAGGRAAGRRLRPAAAPRRTAAPESALFLGKTYPPLTVPGEPGPVFLVGVDLDAAPGQSSRSSCAGPAAARSAARRGSCERRFPEERLTLPPAMVTPPKELEERIAREQALAAEIYRTPGAAKLWDRGFTPALGQKAAGNFGRRRILNGIPKSPHAGQDYTAPAGTPVKAVAGGTVRLAADFYYSGLTLFVDHGAGLVSVYMHLEKILAAEGETVAAGQVVGTGRAAPAAPPARTCTSACASSSSGSTRRRSGAFFSRAAASHLNTARETGISHH